MALQSMLCRFKPEALLRSGVKMGIQPQRDLWGWLNRIFNMVDQSRIKAVGPDRACAEWLLRCGASVKYVGTTKYMKDYNSLPPEKFSLFIQEVDATDSAVMNEGFLHFRGLKHLEKIKLHRCMYVEDEALKNLVLVKDSLKDLQVSSCGDVTNDGILSLDKLINLKSLLLYDLPEVRNKDKCLKELNKSLPGCKIEFPYASPDEGNSQN
ncbi:ATP synthase subunit s, mitochondrial [Ischnura elegans]|uniref:ATP synthase subunit s, mitochondrial n=1 Tax=Ischnura elegans TaxID=197161 RepID=UPI001ED88D97|nr:ATP synthase subunit s, mitochondrial [Ischnura elegans]